MSINIQERFQQASMGEKIILIAAPLYFIFSFFPWFKYDIAGFEGPSRNGWSGDMSFLTIIAVLAALVMLAQIVITRFTTISLPALPQGVTWARVHAGLAAYILLATVLRLLIGEGEGGFDADMKFGIFLAVIAAIALAAGGFLMFQAESKGGGARM